MIWSAVVREIREIVRLGSGQPDVEGLLLALCLIGRQSVGY
jgi:hypothetical protein